MATKKRKRKRKPKKIDIEQILLQQRMVFLFKEINQESAYEVVSKLVALDHLATKPIALYINSPGGACDAGFSIIDAIKGIESPVVTIITGEACSVAGLVSVAGDKRLMSANSVWMAHDMSGGIWGDYTTKVTDRAAFLKQYQKRMNDFLKSHTKLAKKELENAQHGELWLYAGDCVKKGIVDAIIK